MVNAVDVCPDCRGSGVVVLLTSVRPCECRLRREVWEALDEAGVCLTVRTRQILKKLGVQTVGDMFALRRSELRGVKFVRPSTLVELSQAMEALGKRGW